MKNQLNYLSKGFTMVELLVVIAIIGLLAAGILAALNPIEQINRARDTGSIADARELSNAVDAYFAANLQYPWAVADPQYNPAAPGYLLYLTQNATRLGQITQPLVDSGIVKQAFISQVVAENKLYMFHENGNGATYVCFSPTSQSVLSEANATCASVLASDVDQFTSTICPANTANHLYCVPN